jgi:hypothetical protein
MKRWRTVCLVVASTLSVTGWLVGAGAAQASGWSWPGKLGAYRSLCSTTASVCADPQGTLNGYYVGHDEPSLEFKSGVAGSGNDMTYIMTLPVGSDDAAHGVGGYRNHLGV